ncbi:MAG: hypothetical protein [Circular genetic element sp.]|nr:MAG: hypothetical protein [Circular genetic element sp.]
MAKRKSNRGLALTKAQRHLVFNTQDSVSGQYYIDIARELSKANRKLFRQPYCYGIESAEIFFANQVGAAKSILVEMQVAPDNWVVNNAHVKGHALFNEMNQLVLHDNPSIEGKWADFKIWLDAGHRAAFIAGQQLEIVDGDDAPYNAGEWSISTYTVPQHVVDPATGQPLAADITQAHLLGADIGTTGALLSVGLVNAYQQSRSTVFDNNPNTPAGFANSFFNILTDSGSQEPELAAEIEYQNDDPPYDLDDYPGGSVNGVAPASVAITSANVNAPVGYLGSFVAPCGLIRMKVTAFDINGAPATAPAITVKLNMMAGDYKGIAAIPMGQ